ncbi:hypothetical protein HU200_049232 [Digitaria exilis]|uniref:Protein DETOXIFICATION n=1 Tax=Digitaria exilis TaxID=1010633 RepID=A0A835B4W8_9POAL|nr:hypothetical protein HU200_049232 [Digitaria exilis]
MDDKPGAAHEPLLPSRPPPGTAAEAKRLLRLAGPIVASCVLQNIVNMASVMFVGHLGELPLAGASLATSLANVTGYSLLTGMATALDTLCGQAFGARQHHLLGVYKQRAMVVLGLACIPIALIWAYAGQILVFLGQDPEISAEAGAYARWLIPSLAAYVPLQCHVRFLQTQNVVLPVTASSGVTAICHVAVCWALVYKAVMGSKGAALSNAISYAINLGMLAVYVRVSGACKETWSGFSKEAFKDLLRFTELALPSAMMICLEWWSFEVLVLLSGLLPNPQLETSVLSICLNTGALLYMIPLGLTYSISTRVSNGLGAGQPQAAKLATKVVMYMAFNEKEIVTYIAKMLPILGISFFIDGLHSSLSGVLTGCGKQKIGAAVNLGAFYLLGIPMAVLLAFIFHLNGMGLWLGIISGSVTKLLFLVLISWSIDWGKEAVKAKNRVFSSSLPLA